MIGPHGHITPRADGNLCRCGGPVFCVDCWKELQSLPSGERVYWLKFHNWTDEKYLAVKSKFAKNISLVSLED